MAQKTKRNRKNQKVNKSRRRTSTSSKEEIRQPLKNENHSFYSKMMFDGKTIITESQKDDEPVKRRKYTLEDLEREIPIGAELIKDHLDRKVPRSLQYPLPKEIEFKSVLPNPADLGLMPPMYSVDHTKKHRKTRHHRDDKDGENLRLMVDEDDSDHTNRRHKRSRDLFGLP
jgi:hypothetical protein